MQTAKEWRLPPLHLLGVTEDGQWTDVDRLLALGLTYMERDLCPCGCGYPRRVAQDPENEDWFEATESTCFVRRVLDKARDSEKKPEPGVVLGIDDTRPIAAILEGRAPNRDDN
ncbi:hypothetical protein VR010_14960 [Actinomycetaceae bacterium L2_0104]